MFAERGEIADIEKKKLNTSIVIIIMMMKNRKNFWFLSGCGKALPDLGWTQKCKCRLEL